MGSSGYKRWINKKDKDDVDNVKKYPLKVHLWGCIGKNIQNRIHIFEDIMTGEIYQQILEGNILDLFLLNDNLIFQDDNDSKHRSEIVYNWKNAYNIKSLAWPSNSPDLNPIENIWSILKRKVNEIHNETKTDFIKCISEKWNGISKETINNVIDSMSKRILKVIERKGNWIDY